MTINKNSLLVAHDAGAANQMISWIPDDFKSLNLKFYFLAQPRKFFMTGFLIIK